MRPISTSLLSLQKYSDIETTFGYESLYEFIIIIMHIFLSVFVMTMLRTSNSRKKLGNLVGDSQGWAVGNTQDKLLEERARAGWKLSKICLSYI